MLRLTAFILIVMAFRRTQAIESKQSVSSAFESLGYSRVCVASALASCEHRTESDILYDVNSAFKDYSADINASMTDISIRLLNLSSIPFENYLKNISNSIAEQQKLNLKLANWSSTLENEIKLIRDEFNSLKENWENNYTQEEMKLKTEEPKSLNIHDLKNIISGEHFSVKDNPQNCAEASLPDDVTTVYSYKENVPKAFVVYCDQTTDGGGWTVIQNRDHAAIRQDFNRSWNEYVTGFGGLNAEFWLGLDNIHALTNSTSMELRVDLEDYDGVKKYAKYDLFKIGDDSAKYVLTLGNYSGDAGDSLSDHNGMQFSTHDQDNDKWPDSCALRYQSGWWFNSCGYSNLNGQQHIGTYFPNPSFYDGIHWRHFRGVDYSYKKASLKLRPTSNN